MSSVFLSLCLLLWSPPRPSPTTKASSGPGADPELIAAPGARIVRQLESRETAFEAALGGGLLRAVREPFIAPKSGDHWIAVASRDGAGNLSPVRWIRLRVDGDPPSVEVRFEPLPVEGGDERPWLPPGSRARVLAEDPIAGVETSHLALGNTVVEARGGQGSLDLPVERDLEVRGWAVDLVGNRSQDQVARVSVDAEPPRVRVELLGAHVDLAGRWVVGPDTQARAQVVDEESGLARWVPVLDRSETSEGEWAGPWSAGDHELGGHALDRVGNRRDVEAVPIRVDVTPPKLHWDVRGEAVIESEGRRVYGPPVEVTARADDGEAGVASLEWSLAGREWRSVAGPVETAASGLILRSVDRVGNESRLPVQWVLDETAPLIEVRLPSGEAVPVGSRIRVSDGEAITIVVRDDEAGVGTAVYSLDERAWSKAPERIRFRGARKGRLRLRAEDLLGNVSVATWDVQVYPAGGGER